MIELMAVLVGAILSIAVVLLVIAVLINRLCKRLDKVLATLEQDEGTKDEEKKEE
jgi:hypothetical protein